MGILVVKIMIKYYFCILKKDIYDNYRRRNRNIKPMPISAERKNMKVKLLGVKKVDFTNNNGEAITGMNVYVAFPEKNVEGLCTEKIWLKDGINLPKDIKVNDMLDITFDRKGKV